MGRVARNKRLRSHVSGDVVDDVDDVDENDDVDDVDIESLLLLLLGDAQILRSFCCTPYRGTRLIIMHIHSTT